MTVRLLFLCGKMGDYDEMATINGTCDTKKNP